MRHPIDPTSARVAAARSSCQSQQSWTSLATRGVSVSAGGGLELPLSGSSRARGAGRRTRVTVGRSEGRDLPHQLRDRVGDHSSTRARLHRTRRACSTRPACGDVVPGQACAAVVPARPGGRDRSARVSRDGKMYTFAVRAAPVQRREARVRARSPGPSTERSPQDELSLESGQLRDIVGAADVAAGRAKRHRGWFGRGNTLRSASSSGSPRPSRRGRRCRTCARSRRHSDRSGGPARDPSRRALRVAEYRPDERIVLRPNRFYGGSRPSLRGLRRPPSRRAPRDAIETVDATRPTGATRSRRRSGTPCSGRCGGSMGPTTMVLLPAGFTVRLLVFNASRPSSGTTPCSAGVVNFALDRFVLNAATTAVRPTSTCPTPSWASATTTSTRSPSPISRERNSSPWEHCSAAGPGCLPRTSRRRSRRRWPCASSSPTWPRCRGRSRSEHIASAAYGDCWPARRAVGHSRSSSGRRRSWIRTRT